MIVDKFILWAAFVVAFITYSFWSPINEYLQANIFYLGNSFFIFLLCLFLFNKNRASLVCFLLLGVALNNFLDELFFNPTEVQLNEMILLLIAPVLWRLKTKNNARKNT